MRCRTKLVATFALTAIMLLAVWFAHRREAQRPRIAVGFATASGHFPEPALLVAPEIVVLWVTNAGTFPLTLDDPTVQFENVAGRLVTDNGPSWNGEARGADLASDAAAWLASGFDSDRQQLKFIFDYHAALGPMRTRITRVLFSLPLEPLRNATYKLLRRSLMSGEGAHAHYESGWIVNPQGRASGRQPFSSDTNRTSAAAASRRSP